MRNEDILSHEKEWLQYHYDMWDYIMHELGKDPHADLDALKRQFMREHDFENREIICNCFLCDMYSCAECPLYSVQGAACTNNGYDTYYAIAADPDTKYSRVDAAKAIRDCVIDWRN